MTGLPGHPRALVLGAGGFLGRHITVALRTAGWHVCTGTRATTPQPGTLWLDPVRAPSTTLIGTLRTLRPALVVNAAGALWNVTPDELHEGNVVLVERLVDAITSAPAPIRFLHLGSAYEYGIQPPGTHLRETHPARPVSTYATTKLAGTRIVVTALAQHRLTGTVLRLGLTVGAGASQASLLGGLAHQLTTNPAAVSLPTLDGARDLVDVRDVARAVVAAAQAPALPDLINIGQGRLTSIQAAAETLIRLAGCTAPVRTSLPPATRRDVGAGANAMDITRAREWLRWSPAHTTTDALRSLWLATRQPSRTPAVPTPTGNGDSRHG